jgi:hypothetical protein
VPYCSKQELWGREKQPLLENGPETFVSRQWLGKHVPATTDPRATIEVLLETVFSAWIMQSDYKEGNWGN